MTPPFRAGEREAYITNCIAAVTVTPGKARKKKYSALLARFERGQDSGPQKAQEVTRPGCSIVPVRCCATPINRPLS
jgi:hypothetical protein